MAWANDVAEGKVWTKYYEYDIITPINNVPAVGTYYANIVNKVGNSQASVFSNQIKVFGPENLNLSLDSVYEADFSTRQIKLEPKEFNEDVNSIDTYQWVKNENIENANNLIYTIDLSTDTSIEDKEAIEGLYILKATRTRNGKTINQDSNTCEVKFTPASLYRNTKLIDVDTNKLLEAAESIIGHTIKVKVEEDLIDFNDSVTYYKWYKNGSLIDNNTDSYIPEEACVLTVESWRERKGLVGKSDSVSVTVTE